jgi:hypothetical protein
VAVAGSSRGPGTSCVRCWWCCRAAASASNSGLTNTQAREDTLPCWRCRCCRCRCRCRLWHRTGTAC